MTLCGIPGRAAQGRAVQSGTDLRAAGPLQWRQPAWFLVWRLFGLKVIGLIGGMSRESAMLPDRRSNPVFGQHPGGFSSVTLIPVGVDFRENGRVQRCPDPEGAGRRVAGGMRTRVLAGARLRVPCTTLLHRAAPAIEAAVILPLPHGVGVAGGRTGHRETESAGLTATRVTRAIPQYHPRPGAADSAGDP